MRAPRTFSTRVNKNDATGTHQLICYVSEPDCRVHSSASWVDSLPNSSFKSEFLTVIISFKTLW